MSIDGETAVHFRVRCGQRGCGEAIAAAPEHIQQVVYSKSGEFALVLAHVPAVAKCDRTDCGEAMSQNMTDHPVELAWLESNIADDLFIVEGANTPALFPGRMQSQVLFPNQPAE